MATFDRRICGDLNRSRGLEWLLANGRGGFAMGSVAGMLARRYHGLLVAAPESPVHRYVTLAKLEPTVRVNGRTTELGVNDYPGAIHPRGDLWLEAFTDEPCPTWRWTIDGATVEQRVRMVEGRDAVVAWFTLRDGPATVEIEVRPLCTSRFYHQLTRQDAQGEPRCAPRAGGVALSWVGRGPPLHLDSNAAFELAPDWYRDFCLGEESRRGYDDRQDLFRPGVFRATLRRGDATGLVIAAATEQVAWRDAARAAEGGESVTPQRQDVKTSKPGSRSSNPQSAICNSQSLDAVPLGPRLKNCPEDTRALLDRLVAATRPFLVSRPDGRRTLLAGYPWFGDWGRDTFISLPGLCLVTGRHELAREILASFARFIDHGMVPNRFPDQTAADASDAADYNTVDASLWYVHAVGRTLEYSGNAASIESLYSAVHAILTEYAAGTRYGIRLDDDGLLASGEPGVQLTWMDAKIGEWVVTPRTGKAVEINALWYNALCTGAELARRFGHTDDARLWSDQAEFCESSFNVRFWDADRKHLLDVIDVDHKSGAVDESLRPNQLLALSLRHPVLRKEHWRPVAQIVRDRLWTPLGLRTLDPHDPQYKPHYAGNQSTRDVAYHQGTVWPWLLGPMVTAWTRAMGATPAARAQAGALLAGLAAHLDDAGLGGVSEVADGDPPHAPGGCPWQAWSVAEPLRAMVEDVLDLGPRAQR